MPHMKPYYTAQDFVTGETVKGDSFAIPADVCGTGATVKLDKAEVSCTIGADGPSFEGMANDWPKGLAALAALVAPYMPEGASGKPDGATLRLLSGKFWGRLSANGFADCTDWDGPHDTELDAMVSLAESYDVNPVDGEERYDGDTVLIKSTSWGVMPTRAEFDAAWSLNVQGHTFSFGNDKRVGTCKLSAYELWAEIGKAFAEHEAGNGALDEDSPGDWLSCVLGVLGFEWI